MLFLTTIIFIRKIAINNHSCHLEIRKGLYLIMFETMKKEGECYCV
jgi:hypothetical protein